MSKKLLKLDNYNRWLHPNLEWRKFAWSEGITIYPAPRGAGTYWIYKQKGEMFKREGNKVYEEVNAESMKEMYADIDRAYERYYKLKHESIQKKKKKK